MSLGVRETVQAVLRDVFAEYGPEDAPLPAFQDHQVMLESGLDSLAFAVVVTELDDRLGFDPFTEAEEPFYPRTVGEFISFYEVSAQGRAGS